MKDEAMLTPRLTNAGSREPVTLAAIMDLPLDILYEIFKHLHPADILYLSRATKALRYTLLRRGAKSTWEYSLKAAGFPMIPTCIDDGMSLPQYVNLIYGDTCFACGSAHEVNCMFMFLDKRCEGCVFEKYCMLHYWKWGKSGPFDPETGYPGRMLHWDMYYGDWVSYTYLVDKEESARIEKGTVKGLRSYTDNLRAKTRQAEEFEKTIHGVLQSEGFLTMT
ncbi:uncharacterized protein SCHCODRAFT_02635543 [Schizophyllum commune H4-8]|uniref:uncharacterized protein n=1 Tax=Schizophyllum commune (strain H4-8 / FGSC 9210) TaxID=578458 RepID=UPI00215FA37A|nr:uncharacterized protein SCHCODRAFT_02635543 [Schizophyllum commune H4-8]KAI5889761.1 hypothetical protein SCHCODRAFT_02635543 [Schizophyllum commune H4-8]